MLVAEDNEAYRVLATEMLARLGIESDLATNGREAVEMTLGHRDRYQAVFMDVSMPEMDGLQATRRIRGEIPSAALPIIAMTASALERDHDACLAAGMDDVVTKPIDRAQLLRTLRRWLPGGFRPAHAAPSTHTSETSLELEGVELEEACDRLGLSAAAVLRLLGRFAAWHADTAEEIREALAAGDGDALGRTAHALAGGAGDLGCRDLHAAARQLERSVREGGADLVDRAEAARFELARILAAVAGAAGRAQRPAHDERVGPEDRTALRDALRSLRVALGAYDLTGASDALHEAQKAAGDGPHAVGLRAVRTLVEAYAFGPASESVAYLLDDLAEPPT